MDSNINKHHFSVFQTNFESLFYEVIQTSMATKLDYF